jgi:hypothetical protein
VSVWVTICPLAEIPESYGEERYGSDAPISEFTADFGFEYYNHDFAEGNSSDAGPVPLRQLLEPCACSASFSDPAVATAESKGLTTTESVFLLYDFAYDPAVTGIERSRYWAFVGCFPFRDETPSVAPPGLG